MVMVAIELDACLPFDSGLIEGRYRQRVTRTRSTDVFRWCKREKSDPPLDEISQEIAAALDVAVAAKRLGVDTVLVLRHDSTKSGYELVLAVDEPMQVVDVSTGERQNARMFEPMYRIWCGQEATDDLKIAFSKLRPLCKLSDDTEWMFNALVRHGKLYG